MNIVLFSGEKMNIIEEKENLIITLTEKTCPLVKRLDMENGVILPYLSRKHAKEHMAHILFTIKHLTKPSSIKGEFYV